MTNNNRGDRLAKKRNFESIRHAILFSLDTGSKTVNEIAKATEINWRTVDNHLTWLFGRELVEKTMDTAYAKIFDLTEEGRGIICQHKINTTYDHLRKI